MKFYTNIIGSHRHEGYNLPAYVDFALRSKKINWPANGSVKRFHLPRMIFRRTYCFINFRKA